MKPDREPMKLTSGKRVTKKQGWLLFFYSIPSKPVSNRMKIWRKLGKAGAVALKGSVYILPLDEEHYEFFQWLVSEVTSMGGEAAFTGVEKIDSMKDQEIVDLFVRHVEEDGYQQVKRSVAELEIKVNSIRKGSKLQNAKAFAELSNKITKAFEEARETDFFQSRTGKELQAKIKFLQAAVKGFIGLPEKKEISIPRKNIEDYQSKIWVSRKRPFVDRMASAWLIRRFIDRAARFNLADEKVLAQIGQGGVTFDVTGGVFTHVGDLCTFEVLIKSFGLKDKALRKIAEIVHELDIKDDKYSNPEAQGVENILSGIRKTAKNDMERLEKGIDVFEMLYASRG
jgi:hypothetical protein